MKLKDFDTLFLRIFLLLLVAFSISSWLAYEVFRATAPPPHWREAAALRHAMPPPAGSAAAAEPPPPGNWPRRPACRRRPSPSRCS